MCKTETLRQVDQLREKNHELLANQPEMFAMFVTN